MEEARFWQLVNDAGQEGDAAFLPRLRSGLSQQPPAAVKDFGVILARLVLELQTDQFCSVVAERDALVAEGAGSDHLDYVAAAVVASGSTIYRQVLARPGDFGSRPWDDNVGDDLMGLTLIVHQAQTNLPYEDQAPGPDRGGLVVEVTTETCPPDMPAWRRSLSGYAEWFALEAERKAWRAWLQPTGLAQLVIVLEIEWWHDLTAGLEVRVGDHVCEVTHVRTNEAQLPADQQVSLAEEDLRYLIDQLEVQLKLHGNPPSWPPAHELKAELRGRRRVEQQGARCTRPSGW